TTFNVTNGNDSGAGSFADAMTAATNDATGPHVIEFDPGLVVTLTSTSPFYNGSQDLTINGNGSTITSNSGSSRAMILVTDAAVVVNDLTMTDTSVNLGGAIFSNGDGPVTVNDSVLSDHAATNGAGAVAGIDGGSTLTLNRVVVTGNSSTSGAGGAINWEGPLVVNDSVFEDNHAPASSGGAVLGQSDVTVDRSYFADNSAQTTGAGVYGQTGGTTTSVTNSTFVNNDLTGTFAGGAAITGPDLRIDHSTFSGNDGTAALVGQVVFSSANSGITRSVLVEPGADDRNCGGDLNRTTGFVYSTDGSCTGFSGVQTGDVENGADPLLGQPRNNGPAPGVTEAAGPTGVLSTMFPLNGSPLIDAIPAASCSAEPELAVDQRQVARPFGDGCDIGAIEAVFPAHGFTDATPFYEATIRWVTSEVNTPRILNGFPDNTFGQGLNIIRGDAARLYYRAAGAPDVSGLPAHGFTDVPPFYEDAVTWAKNEGVFNGFPDNTFRHNLPITRADYTRSLYGFVGNPDVSPLPQHGFTDVTPFYENSVRWAKGNGLADGFGDNTFRLGNQIIRGNAGRIFYNTAQTPAAWPQGGIGAPDNMLFRSNLD
ncbi:MAG: S-layer homology domain-containing protein, partial [Actinomycetota bacterium]